MVSLAARIRRLLSVSSTFYYKANCRKCALGARQRTSPFDRQCLCF